MARRDFTDHRDAKVPYAFGRPLDFEKDQGIWVDRKVEREAVERRLATRKWVALLGREGMGRTSFLEWFRRRPTGVPEHTVPMMLCLPSIRPEAAGGPIKGLAIGLRQELETSNCVRKEVKNRLLELLQKKVPTMGSPFDLQDLVLSLAERCPQRSCLLIIDDADLADESVRDVALPTLRALFTDLSRRTELNIGLIISGVERGPWLTAGVGGTSPLGNVVSDFPVQPLSVSQVEALAEHGREILGVRMESRAVEEAVRLTRGLPAEVQRLLYDIYDYAVRHDIGTITRALVMPRYNRLAAALPTADPRQVDERLSRLETIAERLAHVAELQVQSDPLRDLLAPLRAEDARAQAVREEGSPGERYYRKHRGEIQEQYPGEWIAVTATGVIAAQKADKDLADQLTEMDLRGQAPYIVFVEPTEGGAETS